MITCTSIYVELRKITKIWAKISLVEKEGVSQHSETNYNNRYFGMFREGWISINSVPTRVMTWGGWIEDEIEDDTVLVCIPGNPGITDFYYYFLENLHSCTGIPVWIINHAGFEPPPKHLVEPSVNEYPEFYNLAGQVEHKRTFIQNYARDKKRIILIGHSVGGKIIAELMKDDDIASKVSQAHLIFPTLQHIAESPNGRIFTSFGQYLIPVIVFLAWICGVIFPRGIQLIIIKFYFMFRADWSKCHQETCLEGTLKLFTASSAKVALTLAKDEMYKIKDLDTEVYDKYFDRIYCYFTPNDRWAPVNQYHDLIKKHPKIQGEILDTKFTHAFVLTTPKDMAEKLSKNIVPQLKK